MDEAGSPYSGDGGTATLRLGRVSRDTLLTQVHDGLRRGLTGGTFLPGESVTLRQLAELFGTSVMPVREAVSRLIAERALVMLPNRKVIVPEMTRARFEDLTALRRLVEAEAGRRACSRFDAGGCRELDAINRRLLKAIATRNVHESLAANRDFHFAVYNAAGSDAILHVISNLWLQVGPFLYLSMTAPEVPWTAEHHQTIVDALRAKDGERVAEGLVQDIDETARTLFARNAFDG